MSNGWLLRAAGIAVLVSMANCGGEAGFDPEAERVFFGLNGDGACDSLEVEIDLEGSLLHHPTRHTVDCVISTDLRFDGCTADFDESDDGLTLFATITGCEIPRTSELFHCGFFSTDDRLFQGQAQCACANQGCDRTPPLCIDGNQDPDSCEICDNGRDDDGDGRTDCADPNCDYASECETSTTTSSTTSTTSPPTTTTLPPPTTSTAPPTTTTLETTTTSTTTTTVGPTTTTTIVVGPASWKVLFHLDTASDSLGALQWSTAYGSAPGEFDGNGAGVACTNKVGGALFAPNDDDGAKNLTLGLIALTPFAAPTDLVECTFTGTDPVPGDFPVTIEDSTNGDGAPATATISVSVTVVPQL